MTRLSRSQESRLHAMGIDLWVARDIAPENDGLRVRLSSGHGSWLLVQRQPWRGQFESLLADITATLGVAECRFGQWANSQDAGVSVSELAGHGVRYVLCFGAVPAPTDAPSLIEVASMQAIHDDPSERKALWAKLQAVL